AALAIAFDKHQRNGRIDLERIERHGDAACHLQRQRVDGLRPVQRDHPQRPLARDNEVGGCQSDGAHVSASINFRATITRMISLVPSRIWWTRRSRTIFSIPYSLKYP